MMPFFLFKYLFLAELSPKRLNFKYRIRKFGSGSGLLFYPLVH